MIPAEGDEAAAGRLAAGGSLRVTRGLLLTVIVSGFAVAIAWPFGGEAMLAGGLGAFFAGLGFALMDVGMPIDEPVRRPRSASDEGAVPAASDPHLRRHAPLPAPRVASPGEEQRLAQALFAEERLYDQAYWRSQPRVHTLIIGEGALASACLEEAVFAGIAGQLAQPRVTFLCRDPEALRSNLAFAMPELASSAEVVVADVPLDLPTSFERAVADADAVSPLTAIVLCAADEGQRLRHMLWLDTIARRRDRALAPVFALSLEPSAAMPARSAERRGDLGARVVVRAGPDASAAERAAAEDATAQRMHEAYLAAFGDRAGSDVPWKDLPETFRIANRRAARHLPQKLWSAGLSWPGSARDAGAVAPEFFASVVQPTAANLSEDALLRRLARLEHDRWCADRRLEGWTRAPDYDASRRRHPSLVPFDDPSFTAGEIAKDIEQVRFLLANVAFAAADGVAAPMVLGVNDDEAAGIDLAAALALIGIEPRRPVVLVSALLRDRECAAVQRLVGALRGGGRAFRLLVPTLARDNAPLRALSAEGAGRLDALLGHPETAVVPIHLDGSSRHEGWADPDAQAADLAALAAYIRARAGSIVSEAGHAMS